MTSSKRKSLFLLVAMVVMFLQIALVYANGQTDDGAKVEEKTLVVVGNVAARHFNGAVQSGLATGAVSTQIFASPIRFDKDWNPQPYLAKSWEISEDGLSVTLHLVEGATFHDGKPITSEDVAFSIMTIKANHPFKTMMEPITGVETPDANTAVIILDKPHAAILLALSPPLCPIIPKHIFGDGQEVKTHPRNLDPVGSGPYRFVKYETEQFVELEAYDNFFIPDRPKFDRLIIRYIYDNNNRMMAVKRGEVDMEYGCDSSQNLLQYKASDNLEMTLEGYAAMGPIQWLEFNLRKSSSPIINKDVRKAIAYAIDQNYLVDQVFSGLPQKAAGPFAPGSQFWVEGLETYEVDLAKANALLDTAGYSKDSSGNRFELTLDYEPAQIHRMSAEYIKAQLVKIGIQITLRPAPDFASWANRVANAEFDLTMNNLYNWGDPVIGVHRSYISENIKNHIFTNTAGYKNVKIDELSVEAGGELNLEKRKELYTEFSDIIIDELPVYSLLSNPYHTVYRKGLHDVVNSVWGPMSPLDMIYSD